MSDNIKEHEGKKYLRKIYSAENLQEHLTDEFVYVDVYQVLKAFNVTCQARGQAIKKLLCAGIRGKGDTLADLVGAQAAISRAIDLQKQTESIEENEDVR